MNTEEHLKKVTPILLWLSVALVGYTNYVVFMVVPNEVVMGAVQRVFYFHVGAAIASYVALAVLLIASLTYLANKNVVADVVAESAAEVALLLSSIVLASGMIWGHSAWNTWFSWEPRLVSFLLLWLLLSAYCVLRHFGDPARVGAHCAVLGIIGAINVPIVVYSIKLLPQLSQLHPQIVERQGLKDPLFRSTMFLGMGTLVCLQFFLLAFRTRIALIERKLSGKG